MNQSKWFLKSRHKRNTDPRLKILCFPYAGGSASTYTSWHDWLPNDVELLAVQPPGRADRLFEESYCDMPSLIETLLPAVKNVIDCPYILFGHSLGSRVAFELMVQLNKEDFRQPSHFIASGSRGPHIPTSNRPKTRLSDEEFISHLRTLKGTPEAILQNEELIQLLLPTLRSDFQLSYDYIYAANSVFNCPVSVFGGEEDIDISLVQLESWGEFFTHPASIHCFKGGHFFIEKQKEAIKRQILDITENVLLTLQTKAILV